MSDLPVPSVCLVVLDGWGLAEPGPGNAVSLADTPVFDDLWARCPHTTLTAQGEAVGLPEGQMGNSEVGHLNLGAGAVVKQDLTRIDEAADGGTLDENEVLVAAMSDADRDREQAERTRILYGGSVKPDSAPELLALPDVDGALVGGASLEVDSFAAIIDAAVAAARS